MKLIGPFAQLLTMKNMPLKGALKDEQLEIIEQAGIVVDDEGIIQEVGLFKNLKSNYPEAIIDSIKKGTVALPGFIDSHTHICWAGTRAKDFAMRNSGKTYLDIAKEGGGIWSSVLKTREASKQELVDIIVERSNKLLSLGTTTVEVKSGYGLSTDSELKMLRAIKIANKRTDQKLIPTCLAAHTLPKDFEGSHAEYLQKIQDELFPILVEENLTTRMDAFIEEEAFNEETTLAYFNKAKELGMDITVHADQFSTGGSALAVKIGAVSADHLEASGDKEIKLLSESDTVATALPGATIGLGVTFTPARKLLDAGACVSIASDWNPGSAPQGDLIAQASILATFQKLSNAEVLAGITFRAAHALREESIGIIKEGYKANLVTFKTSNYQEIIYQQGQLKPNSVYINGKKVFKADSSFF